MISVLFVVATIVGFVVAASMGMLYLKPACPKCGSRSAVSYKKGKGRGKKRAKTSYTCEECERDFRIKKGTPVAFQAKLLLGAAAACIVLLGANHGRYILAEGRTLSTLRDNVALDQLVPLENKEGANRQPSYRDLEYAVFKRTTFRENVEAFLDSHDNARRVASTANSITYAVTYGWLPSYRTTITFDSQGRYLDRSKTLW